MHTYLFMLTHGDLERGEAGAARVRQCLRLAKLAALKGRRVTLFLLDDAVTLARRMSPRVRESLPTPPRDEIDTLLDFLRKAGVGIVFEKKSARARLSPAAPLPEGVALRGEANLIDMAEDAKVFSF